MEEKLKYLVRIVVPVSSHTLRFCTVPYVFVLYYTLRFCTILAGGEIEIRIIIVTFSSDSLRFLCYTNNVVITFPMYVCMYVWSSHIAEYGSTG